MELSTTEAGIALGLSDQAIRDHIDAGRLTARRQGMRPVYRIHIADLRTFAAAYGYAIDENYLANLTPHDQ